MTKILIYLAICTIGMSGLYFTAYDLLVKRQNLVTLPDGHGFYVKNDELTQEILDIVPVGMNIMMYGIIKPQGQLKGKGVDKTVIVAGDGSSIVPSVTDVWNCEKFGGDGK